MKNEGAAGLKSASGKGEWMGLRVVVGFSGICVFIYMCMSTAAELNYDSANMARIKSRLCSPLGGKDVSEDKRERKQVGSLWTSRKIWPEFKEYIRLSSSATALLVTTLYQRNGAASPRPGPTSAFLIYSLSLGVR